jgi:hypothetical protein
MDVKVHNYNETKHQDHAPHLKGKAKGGHKRIELVPTNWATLKVAMEKNYEIINPKYIKMRLDVVK